MDSPWGPVTLKPGGLVDGIDEVLPVTFVNEDLLALREAVGEGGPEFLGDLPVIHLLDTDLLLVVPFRSAFSRASASSLESFTLVCPSIRALSIRLCA